MVRTITDNLWGSFSLLESAERREGTEDRHRCCITALGQMDICTLFGAGYVTFTRAIVNNSVNN